MSEQAFNTISEDEISLKDIIDFLVESWKTILLGGVLGGLLGLGYAAIAPVKFQATASIQVAKVAGEDVEAPALLLEKLKMPMYYSQKTYVACNVMEKLEPGEVIVKIIKPTLLKPASIITISYQDVSPEDAKKCLEGIVDDVRIKQGLLYKQIFENKNHRLVNLRLQLESNKRVLKALPKQNDEFDFSDAKFSALSFLFAKTLSVI
jgi:LPS O-antigen subunit length determinant protein (WzzB/FepE family)